MMCMLQNHRNNLLLIFMLAFILIGACTEKIDRYEPLYKKKQEHSPLTFGPGTHRKLIIYTNVSGWVHGREPEWTSCQSLKPSYVKLIKKYTSFKDENINVFTFGGTTWISSFIMTNNDYSTVFLVTEWDDDANYDKLDQKSLVETICQKLSKAD